LSLEKIKEQQQQQQNGAMPVELLLTSLTLIV
jgi:hypothetical protein